MSEEEGRCMAVSQDKAVLGTVLIAFKREKG